MDEGRHEGDCRYRDINLGIGYAVVRICQLCIKVPTPPLPVGIAKERVREV